MRPDGRRSDHTKKEIEENTGLARSWYDMFVAASEEIMTKRREGGHPVNAGYQIAYFVLYVNMFRGMGIIDNFRKMQIIKVYTDTVSQFIPRANLVDVINHFEDLYKNFVDDGADNIKAVEGQKEYIMALEMDISGPDADPDDIADCLAIASACISQMLTSFSMP